MNWYLNGGRKGPTGANKSTTANEKCSSEIILIFTHHFTILWRGCCHFNFPSSWSTFSVHVISLLGGFMSSTTNNATLFGSDSYFLFTISIVYTVWCVVHIGLIFIFQLLPTHTVFYSLSPMSSFVTYMCISVPANKSNCCYLYILPVVFSCSCTLFISSLGIVS